MIYNKIDLYRKRNFDELLETEVKEQILEEVKINFEKEYDSPSLFISALSRENLTELRSLLKERISELYEKRYPYQVKYW